MTFFFLIFILFLLYIIIYRDIEKWAQTDSLEIPDRGETSEIPSLTSERRGRSWEGGGGGGKVGRRDFSGGVLRGTYELQSICASSLYEGGGLIYLSAKSSLVKKLFLTKILKVMIIIINKHHDYHYYYYNSYYYYYYSYYYYYYY